MEKRLRALGILGVISLLSYTAMVCLHLHFDTNYDYRLERFRGFRGCADAHPLNPLVCILPSPTAQGSILDCSMTNLANASVASKIQASVIRHPCSRSFD